MPHGLRLGAMADAVLNVDHFIAMDRQTIQVQFAIGVVLLLIGSAVTAAGFSEMVPAGKADIETIVKLGGFVMDLVGLYPFNNCWTRWQRINTLRAMQRNPALLQSEDARALLNKLYEKFLGVSS
jgi:hypothetical protein